MSHKLRAILAFLFLPTIPSSVLAGGFQNIFPVGHFTTNPETFEIFVGNISTFGFGGIAEDDSFIGVGSVLIGSAAMIPGSLGFVVGADAGFGGYGRPFFSAQSPDGVDNEFRIDFEQPVQGVGLTYGSYFDASSEFNVLVTSGIREWPFTLSLPDTTQTTSFLGIWWPLDGIDSIVISQVTGGTVFDLLDLGLPSPVPLPATLWILAPAVAGLGLLRRRAA